MSRIMSLTQMGAYEYQETSEAYHNINEAKLCVKVKLYTNDSAKMILVIRKGVRSVMTFTHIRTRKYYRDPVA